LHVPSCGHVCHPLRDNVASTTDKLQANLATCPVKSLGLSFFERGNVLQMAELQLKN
jgi:hypothetical protein